MIEIAEETLVSRKRALIEASVARELVALNIDSGLCYGLNETAAAIWRHLAEPLSLDELLTRLVQDFVVTPDEIRADVVAILVQLHADELVHIGRVA